MNEERALWKEQRRQKLFETQKLEETIKELRSGIRVDLNPHVPVEEIKGDLVHSQAVKLKDSIILYLAAKKDLANLDESLGIS